MPARINILGKRFGRILVVALHSPHWECLCDCGKTTLVLGNKLLSGRTRSCGCYSAELSKMRRTTHGLSKSPEYIVWLGMISRCYRPENGAYKNYGGRGIKVCKRWHNFSNFIKDMGRKPFTDAQIDRKRNSGHYTHGNCRWTDRFTQGSNKRNNHLIEINGEVATVSEWARRIGLRPNLAFSRITKGWDPVRSVTTKPQKHGTNQWSVRFHGSRGEPQTQAGMQNNK